MSSHCAVLFLAGLSVAAAAADADADADAPTADTRPIDCSMCADWNAPQAPFHVHGRTWYVGPKGLSSVLIDSGKGLVLLDGALPQSADEIVANIRALGFDVADIEWIVNSHAHFDHAGGIAALQRMSGAQVASSERGAEGLRLGNATADDPQAAMGAAAMAFPPIEHVIAMADGASIELGDLKLTANYTPGHTPGGVTWTWRSCEEGDCIDMVYADSLTAFSAPDFRFTQDPATIAGFQRSLRKVATLPCDILISTHPEASELFTRRDADVEGNPFIDDQACRAYAGRSSSMLGKRIADETAVKAD